MNPSNVPRTRKWSEKSSKRKMTPAVSVFRRTGSRETYYLDIKDTLGVQNFFQPTMEPSSSASQSSVPASNSLQELARFSQQDIMDRFACAVCLETYNDPRILQWYVYYFSRQRPNTTRQRSSTTVVGLPARSGPQTRPHSLFVIHFSGHSFCRDCLEDLNPEMEGKILCPSCRVRSNAIQTHPVVFLSLIMLLFELLSGLMRCREGREKLRS